ncbi:MAG: hypothetical protein KGL39_11430 [Patescibacteria group bacterium]|nr:hypothetical protein [Patescibacteria group bacterium]
MRSTKAIVPLFLLAGIASAQCLIFNTATCPNGTTGQLANLSAADSAYQSPAVQSWMTSIDASLDAAAAWAAPLPQPTVTYSAQLVPLNPSWAEAADAYNCNTSGPGGTNACVFDTAAVGNAWLDAMKAMPGGGIMTVDWNAWLGPLEAAAECGSPINCQASGYTGFRVAWMTYALSVMDAVMLHAQANGQTVRIAPTPTGDVWIDCGITFGSITGAQLTACMPPLEAALVKRYGVTSGTVAQVVTDITLIHEPTVNLKLETGMYFSLADMLSYTNSAYTTVHSANSHVRIGYGYTGAEDYGCSATSPSSCNSSVCVGGTYAAASGCSGASGSGTFSAQCAGLGCDFLHYIISNTTAVLGFYGADIYGNQNPTAYYSGIVAVMMADCPAIKAAGAVCVVNESGQDSHAPSSSNGTETTGYEQTGWSGFDLSGYNLKWSDVILHKVAPAAGFTIISDFRAGPLFCSSGGIAESPSPGYIGSTSTSDTGSLTGYTAFVVTNCMKSTTAMGRAYVPHWAVSVQGPVTTSGYVTMGN